MNNDLQSIYDSILFPKAVTESTETSKQEGEVEILEEKKAPKFLKKKGKEKSKREIGAKTYNDSTSFENIFANILKEDFGDESLDDVGGEGDTTFDYDGEGDESLAGGDDQTFTLSELRSMSLGEIADLLAGGGSDDLDDTGSFDSESDEDEIPLESYGFEGGGASHGMQGTYDGKAKSQGKSTHVKGNGDADFGKQDTGYNPEDTEGSEGSEHGMQDDYDGKAKSQAKSPLVKGNGDADFGKQKTGAKTSSGKKDKDYF